MEKCVKKAYAKINLGLDVIGRLPNGYHEVKMIMQSVSLHDVITINALDASKDIIIRTSSGKIPCNEQNLAYKAAKLMMETYSISNGVDIYIEKNIPIAAGIINFVVLTSAASACNSGLFSTSRILYNLSNNNQAPKQLGKLNQHAVPSNALFTSTLVISAATLLSWLLPGQAFTIVTTISAICFIWVWSIILISHIKYMKTRPDLRAQSTFKAPLTPFINYVILGLFAFILIVMLFAEATRIPLLLTPIWFITLLLIYKNATSINDKPLLNPEN